MVVCTVWRIVKLRATQVQDPGECSLQEIHNPGRSPARVRGAPTPALLVSGAQCDHCLVSAGTEASL